MSTAVKVCSDALVELGLRPINSFTDLSDRALAAANLYPNVRDSVLRSHPWNCATKRVALSPELTPPAFGFSYAFLLPGDCLRVLSIGEYPDRECAYAIESGKLLTDENPVYLRYIWRNENPATWDPSLFRAMTLAMAAVLAIPATEDVAKKQNKEAELLAHMRTARAVDGMEQPPEEFVSFQLLEVRF